MYSGIGRLGREIEILTMNNENKPFTVSNNVIFFKERIGSEDVPIEVVFYNGANTYLQKRNIKKGDFIYVEGFFKQDKWMNANNEPRKNLKLVVTSIVDPNSSNTQNDDSYYFDDQPSNFLDKK